MDNRIGRFIMVAILLLFGLISIGSSAGSQDEVVLIKPWYSEVTIGPGQVGVIRWAWANCTKGITTDWVNATEQSWILKFNGEVIQTISTKDSGKYWGAPTIAGNQSYVGLCAWPAAYVWESTWEFSSLKLRLPGDYELIPYIAINEPLIDGFDLDQNGQIDWYDGVINNQPIIIHVIE